MTEQIPPDLTQLLHRAGDDDHAKEELYAEVYDDLKAAAHRLMRRQKGGDFQTTALVNEAILRFEKGDALQNMANRRVFFSVALR